MCFRYLSLGYFGLLCLDGDTTMIEEKTIPSKAEAVREIREKMNLPDIYEQLAEEAAELSQAANKMARVLRGTNPTPVKKDEAEYDLIEEYTDVILVARDILSIDPDWLTENFKLQRWARRLRKKEGS